MEKPNGFDMLVGFDLVGLILVLLIVSMARAFSLPSWKGRTVFFELVLLLLPVEVGNRLLVGNDVFDSSRISNTDAELHLRLLLL